MLMLCQQTKVEDRAEVLIIGVATSEKPKQLEVLLDDGESLFIDSELWNPFDKELEEVAVRVTVQIKGKQIMQIKKKNQCELKNLYSSFVCCLFV